MGKGGSVSAREGTVMSQDAPVNTGAVSWPGLFSAEKTVARMQAKLHLWAARDPGRRFGDLFNLVYDPAFLRVAWERVATNKGAGTPGVDKATAGQIETGTGVEAFLGQIRDSLKSGEFGPVEVRRVLIPKKSGKLRKLGIPTIADRVVQASLKLVLEPIFEADFKPCSYGFRPNRRAQDAIAEIHHFASEPSNYRWVLEADIKACFDEIDHTALMNRRKLSFPAGILNFWSTCGVCDSWGLVRDGICHCEWSGGDGCLLGEVGDRGLVGAVCLAQG